MKVDKFGHHVHKRLRHSPELCCKALIESEIGEFDLCSKRLKGVKIPTSADDVANKEYVDNCASQMLQEFNLEGQKLEKRILSTVRSYLEKILIKQLQNEQNTSSK